MILRIIPIILFSLHLYFNKKTMKLSTESRVKLNQALSQYGLRSTRHREQVYSTLLSKHDHPTTDEIYNRAKGDMPTISLATVYNCLDTLVDCGLARQVNFERESTRYCPMEAKNVHYAHFHCKHTGKVHDIHIPAPVIAILQKIMPEGFNAEKVELCFRGTAPCENESSED